VYTLVDDAGVNGALKAEGVATADGSVLLSLQIQSSNTFMQSPFKQSAHSHEHSPYSSLVGSVAYAKIMFPANEKTSENRISIDIIDFLAIINITSRVPSA